MGQGSGGSPAFWLATSETILNTMDSSNSGYMVTSPDEIIWSSRTEDKFIDDASLMTNTSGGVDLVRQIKTNSQIHERISFCRGGQLATHKCFWTLIKYHWSGWKATIEHYDVKAREELGNKDRRITLTRGRIFFTKHVIKRIGVGDTYRTLGVYIAASGDQRKQWEVLLGKAHTWSLKMKHWSSILEEKLISFQQQMMRY